MCIVQVIFGVLAAGFTSVTSGVRCVLADRTRPGPFGKKLLSPRVSDRGQQGGAGLVYGGQHRAAQDRLTGHPGRDDARAGRADGGHAGRHPGGQSGAWAASRAQTLSQS